MKRTILILAALTIFNFKPVMAMNTDYSYIKYGMLSETPKSSISTNKTKSANISSQIYKKRCIDKITNNSNEWGTFDEYRLNSNFSTYYDPRSSRMDGFDEFKYVGE